MRNKGWLLFFYTVHSKPVSSRMKVWRRLMKAGAIQLKGAVYILPFSDEHYEFLQWLVSEIAAMKGEGAFARIDKIDTMRDSAIISLFDQQRAGDYKRLEKTLDDIERKLSSIQKGAKARDIAGMAEQFNKLLKDFGEVKKVDFFSSRKGRTLQGRMKHIKTEINNLPGAEERNESPIAITPRSVVSYRGKTWVTRKKPFIDRMASAWLIRSFVDKKAIFTFMNENKIKSLGKKLVAFDVRDGEFTHTGDMCTFEVIIKSFGLKDKALKMIAKIVHDLDIKDDKYKAEEAKGLEDILIGIRKTSKNDRMALEKGIAVFEMLYASKS